MYMKVFPHGQGDGEGPTRYLVRPDYPGRDEHPPEVLRGDTELTHALIDSLDTKWKFTAGVLSWHPDDTVTPEQERCVMDDFEKVAFAGLEPDQRNILWVRHLHADHHELHFVIPRVELGSGKAFNPCPPGWQKHFDVFRDLHNHREGWARPDDPARARLHTPEHTDLHKARLVRWGKAPNSSLEKDDRAEAKEAIHAYLKDLLEQGRVKNRADVLTALQEAGLEINRAGKDYITVKDPESGEKLRLKGGIYGEHWNFTELPELAGRTHQGQDRAGAAGGGNSDPATVQRLELELAAVFEKRAQYNRGRYPQRTRGYGEEHHFPLPEPWAHLQQEIPVLYPVERGHPEPDRPDLLGAGYAVPVPDNGLAPGNGRAGTGKGHAGREEYHAMEYVQGPGTVSGGRKTLSADTQGLDYPFGGNSRAAGSLGNREEINHDRTGTHTHPIIDGPGTGADRHPGNPRQETFRATTQARIPGPGNTEPAAHPRSNPDRTAGISAALATLERYTHELGTLVGKVEHFIERQIEKARAQAQQRSRGPGMGR